MSKKVLVLLSGGLDSTVAMRLAVEQYGSSNVLSLSFDYGQKQAQELKCAAASSAFLKVEHSIISASFLKDISMGFSANVDPGIKVPPIKEVLGSPQPVTYVPNRNMILMSIMTVYWLKYAASASFLFKFLSIFRLV